jgi:hypothetical protein
MLRVFGYVCLPAAVDRSGVRRWRRRMSTYCVEEGLGSAELVFIDNGVSTEAPWGRPAWTALVDILRIDHGHPGQELTVVLPGLTHLSSNPTTLACMRAVLDQADVRTVVMPKTWPDGPRRGPAGTPPVRRPAAS